MSPGLLQWGRHVSKRPAFLVLVHHGVGFLMSYLLALPLDGDLSKGFKVLAPLTCELCGLAQHLVPHKFHPGWLTDQSGAPVESDYSDPLKGGVCRRRGLQEEGPEGGGVRAYGPGEKAPSSFAPTAVCPL